MECNPGHFLGPEIRPHLRIACLFPFCLKIRSLLLVRLSPFVSQPFSAVFLELLRSSSFTAQLPESCHPPQNCSLEVWVTQEFGLHLGEAGGFQHASITRPHFIQCLWDSLTYRLAAKFALSRNISRWDYCWAWSVIDFCKENSLPRIPLPSVVAP